jgi:GDP-L-fucose synthase
MASMMDLTKTRVVVTGGTGFLGRVVCRKLKELGCERLGVPMHSDYDLSTEEGVRWMYTDFQPEVVIHLAAEVGGIGANREHPGRFFYKNMAMGLHLIEHARLSRVKKFVQAGTVCAYPKLTPVPFREEDLWNGYPEETNAPYGIAKKSLFVMLDAYHQEYGLKSAVVVPVNLFGPGDNFDPRSSHVIPALVRKCVEARDRNDSKMVCWGTGNASREFLYVEDAAEGIVRAAQVMDSPVPINLGTGREISIRQLVELIAKATGFKGRIEWDATKPDGQPRRCLDTTRAEELLDWTAQTSFEQGLRETVAWYELQQGLRKAA